MELTSINYPNSYVNNLRCLWTVQCQEGGRILVEFIDFRTEPGYDYLYIGTAQNGTAQNGTAQNGNRTLTYNGNLPTTLNVVSPANGSPLYFEFYTDGSVTYPGFHLRLTNTDATGKFCDPVL